MTTYVEVYERTKRLSGIQDTNEWRIQVQDASTMDEPPILFDTQEEAPKNMQTRNGTLDEDYPIQNHYRNIGESTNNKEQR